MWTFGGNPSVRSRHECQNNIGRFAVHLFSHVLVDILGASNTCRCHVKTPKRCQTIPYKAGDRGDAPDVLARRPSGAVCGASFQFSRARKVWGRFHENPPREVLGPEPASEARPRIGNPIAIHRVTGSGFPVDVPDRHFVLAGPGPPVQGNSAAEAHVRGATGP